MCRCLFGCPDWMIVIFHNVTVTSVLKKILDRHTVQLMDCLLGMHLCKRDDRITRVRSADRNSY